MPRRLDPADGARPGRRHHGGQKDRRHGRGPLCPDRAASLLRSGRGRGEHSFLGDIAQFPDSGKHPDLGRLPCRALEVADSLGGRLCHSARRAGPWHRARRSGGGKPSLWWHQAPPRNDQHADPVNVEDELFTIRDLLRFAVTRMESAGLAYGHGTDAALDEAVFLIGEELRLPHDGIEPFLDARLTLAERRAVIQLIERRIATRKPAAYLVNRAYIGDVAFYVDERVIVPRSFIGELLWSGRLGDAGLLPDEGGIGRILDLCTGSGCLAILAALAFPDAHVDAVDISVEALAVARRNVDEHGLAERVRLAHGDLFAPLDRTRRYDLIITNPPYVSKATMARLPAEYRHEPELALAGGDDGLDVVRRVLAEAPERLNAEGGLLCEIGAGREILEADYPRLPFFWLDTETSQGEVFWLPGTALEEESA